MARAAGWRLNPDQHRGVLDFQPRHRGNLARSVYITLASKNRNRRGGRVASNNDHPTFRAARLPDGAPLDYAPDNEQGVVYLFSHLARRRFGVRVERVQGGFPYCVAYLGSK